jgi:hypothetical protein
MYLVMGSIQESSRITGIGSLNSLTHSLGEYEINFEKLFLQQACLHARGRFAAIRQECEDGNGLLQFINTVDNVITQDTQQAALYLPSSTQPRMLAVYLYEFVLSQRLLFVRDITDLVEHALMFALENESFIKEPFKNSDLPILSVQSEGNCLVTLDKAFRWIKAADTCFPPTSLYLYKDFKGIEDQKDKDKEKVTGMKACSSILQDVSISRNTEPLQKLVADAFLEVGERIGKQKVMEFVESGLVTSSSSSSVSSNDVVLPSLKRRKSCDGNSVSVCTPSAGNSPRNNDCISKRRKSSSAKKAQQQDRLLAEDKYITEVLRMFTVFDQVVAAIFQNTVQIIKVAKKISREIVNLCEVSIRDVGLIRFNFVEIFVGYCDRRVNVRFIHEY